MSPRSSRYSLLSLRSSRYCRSWWRYGTGSGGFRGSGALQDQLHNAGNRAEKSHTTKSRDDGVMDDLSGQPSILVLQPSSHLHVISIVLGEGCYCPNLEF